MKYYVYLIYRLFGSCVLHSAYAFDTQTHALITRVAYDRSGLKGGAESLLLERLGLDRLQETNVFGPYWEADVGAQYYTNAGQNTLQIGQKDYAAEFERCQMAKIGSSAEFVGRFCVELS